MASRSLPTARLRASLATMTLLGMLTLATPAQAQLFSRPGPAIDCPSPYAPPSIGSPYAGTPSQGTSPDSQSGTTPQMSPSQDAQQAFGQNANFNQESSSARGGDQVARSGGGSGYLDPVIPANRFRLRYDDVSDDNRPDRAEYFYAKCGCFRAAGDPSAPGPILPESRVSYQDIEGYLEVAPWQNFSLFVEAPLRFLNPQNNADATGIGDTKAGFRYAMLNEPEQVLTFQLRNYIPTGNVGLGLGTGHYSLEPSFLYYRQLADKLMLQGQLTDWIPIGGTDFAGNVFSYGAALTYIVYDNGRFRAAPVLEGLGWTVLSGQEFDFPENVTRSAAGVTIINAKFGARFGFGEYQRGFLGKSDLYVGYGRALTGDVWYKDIFRVEYRVSF